MSGATLDRLELGMFDHPISTTLAHKPRFTPLAHENLANPDEEPNYGSLEEDAVIPRPLGDFIPKSSDGKSCLVLPRLKHMHLCQTAKPSTWDCFMEYGWSTRAEAASLTAWKQLLLASKDTLEVLVLEQRPAAQFIERDGLREVDWMLGRTRAASHEPLIEMVKIIALSEGLPNLRKLYMYGIDVGLQEDGSFAANGTAAGRFVDVLRARGVECEARLGMWCFFDKAYGSADWGQWDGSDTEEEEEEDEDENGDEKAAPIKWDTLLSDF
jgi:hypothetical protein